MSNRGVCRAAPGLLCPGLLIIGKGDPVNSIGMVLVNIDIFILIFYYSVFYCFSGLVSCSLFLYFSGNCGEKNLFFLLSVLILNKFLVVPLA